MKYFLGKKAHRVSLGSLFLKAIKSVCFLLTKQSLIFLSIVAQLAQYLKSTVIQYLQENEASLTCLREQNNIALV